ncbi:unnamed protein product [Sphagnum compactum]
MASTIGMCAAAPRRQCQFLADIKDSFERVVQGFWSSLKQRSCKSSLSCLPLLLTRRNGHFSSLVNGIATWPRIASRKWRECSSPPNAQPASSTRPGCRYSLSFPGRGVGVPSASLDISQPPHNRKFNSTSFKTAKRTSSSRGNEEQQVHVMCMSTVSQNTTTLPPPFFMASPDDDITRLWNGLNQIAMEEDSKMYILDGIPEVQHRINQSAAAPEMVPQHEDVGRFAFESEGDGARGESSITSVSENETASTAASRELQEEPRGVQRTAFTREFKGIRQKDNKWISEIRPPSAKRTVWLGTYCTREEAARAYDAGIFYYHKCKTPYNFPDSPKLFPEINKGPKEVSVEFVKTEAKRNAERAWPSGVPSKLTSAVQEQASSSGSSSGGWFFSPYKRRKSSNCK